MITSLLGGIMIIVGLYPIILGKMPWIKEYHGVKRVALHCRLEGSAVVLVGALLIVSSLIVIDSIVIMMIILMIAIFIVTIEIVLKVF